MTNDVTSVGRETLESMPGRVLTFLRAIGTSKSIRRLMVARGYTPNDHQEGWALLHKVSGFLTEDPPEEADVTVRDAIAELDRWDEDGFRLVRAALSRLHPEAGAFVLRGLGPATGAAAVLSVKNLLDRLDALESSPERKATRKEDRAALATLEKRGITPAVRKRLRELVGIAQSAGALDPYDPRPGEAATQQYLNDLEALRAWFLDWSETARAAIKRRDYLIRMGLAHRSTKRPGADEPSGDTADE
ncbi:MAG TPA: hypothetical protein VFS43_32380 [Polyangiaceae bacterium]|nr:hypothetical protein [Polyangiaceae bacterium]